MSRAILFYLFSALSVLMLGHSSTVYGDTDLQFENPRKCNLEDLNLKPKENIIECFPKQDAYNFTVDGTSCLLSVDSPSRMQQNEIALQQCVHGIWTEISLGESKNIKKRFLGGFVIGAVAGFVSGAVAGLAGCAIFCRGGGTTVVTKRPPEFTNCPPADLPAENFVVPRQDKVIVTWTKPTATTDSDGGSIQSINLISGSESGSEFEGSVGGRQHLIGYEAVDNDGLKSTCYFTFTVKKRTCSSAAPLIENGHGTCDLGRELGSICTYSCFTGYELSGNSQVICDGSSSPTWTTRPTCTKVVCPAPPSLENGNVTCSDEIHEYGTSCSFRCNTGFQITGNLLTECKEDGTWSFSGPTSCTDRTGPQISCLTPQIFYADRDANSSFVEWQLPTAVDEIDQNTTIIQTAGQEYGSLFQSGSSIVKYIATDSQGNESPECTIEIRVEVTSCPHPLDVIQDSNMEYSCSTTTTYIYGTECTLTCKFNYPLIGTDLITCERTDPTNLAVGTWSWGNGSKPFCDQIDCPPLDPPVNGALDQSYVQNTLITTMLCNEQFDIPVVSSGFTGQFICLNTGTWNPNIEVPDCIEPRSPRAINLPVEIFYYSGDCNDPATQEQIKSNVEQIFQNSVNVYVQNACQGVTTCITGNLQLLCGETTFRRKRRAAIPRRELYGEQRQKIERQKRELPSMILEFIIITDLNSTLSIRSIDDLHQDEVIPALQNMVQNGTFDINNFTLTNSSLKTAQYGNIVCPPGFVLRGTRCYACPAGYFQNSNGECQLCPVSQYSDEANSTSCKDCPEETTTLGTGSKNQSQCLAICPAGQISANGTLPCTPCRVGYYQSGTGQTTCDQCTTGTTEFTGSVSSDACEAFEILVNDTEGPVNAGSISENMTDLTLMFWTRRYSNLTTNGSLRLQSGGTDVIIVNLTTTIEIQIPGAGFQLNFGSLTSSKWTHVGVSWNTTSNELSVYINGVLNSGVIMLAAPFSPLISTGSVWVESTGNSGIYIADLHIEDAVVPASEIESIKDSCWNDRTDGVYSLNDMRFTPLQGVTIQAPASCDPVDKCADNPCNNHTCISGKGTYTCSCSGGWTGYNCSIPPDYCLNHECLHGATCVNGNNGYTCTCLPRYLGIFCETVPVDGGWSEWSGWSTCTATCDGGNQTRTRVCDNPEPNSSGNNCTGNDVETQACGQGTCPTCPGLPRGFRMTTDCTFDSISGLEICNVSCRAGYVLPPSLSTFTFTCGLNTNYTWHPMPNPPNCVDPRNPDRAAIVSEIRYQSEILNEDTATAEQMVTDNLGNISCVASSTCTSNVVLENPGKKRSAVSNIIVTLTVELTETGALDIANFLETSTVSASLQELIDAINILEEAASYINTSSSSIFDITLNGVTYSSDHSTLSLTANLTCPVGETAVDGVCADCPEGTYYTNGFCSFCEKGTYTSSTGETTCTPCPSGLTTTTIGSYAASQCTVILNLTTTTEATTPMKQENSNNSNDSKDKDGLAMYIGLAVSGVTLIVSLTVCGLVLYKKSKKTKVDNSSTLHQGTRSYRRERSTLTVKDVDFNFKTTFPNPSYKESAHQDGEEVVRVSDLNKTAFQPNNAYENTEEINYIRPAMSPPPPYQEEENGYVQMGPR